MEFPPTDRRARLRFPILVTQVKMGDERKYFFGYAKNISPTGIFVQTISPRDVGETFNIEFIIPKTDITVNCACRVMWNRRYSESGAFEPGMGLKFEDVDESLTAKIEDWIHKQVAELESDPPS